MHRHITMEIGIDEDDSTTLVHATLDLRGDHFHATGRARRNPDDPAVPLIGEELALARALSSLERQIVDRAYERIDTSYTAMI
jgi:Rv2632c-like